MKFVYQRALILAALFYLVAGVLLGLALFLARAFPEIAWILRFRTVHVHLLLTGFVLQLIMGVALWMFPRHRHPPHYTSPRAGLALVVVYNAGIWLRSCCEPFAAEAPALFWLAFGGMLLQAGGIFFFLFLIVRRVRAP